MSPPGNLLWTSKPGQATVPEDVPLWKSVHSSLPRVLLQMRDIYPYYLLAEEKMPVISSKPRGFAIIALDNPKYSVNVGGVLRAAQCFDAALVVVGGMARRYKNNATDTSKAYRHLPLLEVSDLFDVIPHGCIPVAVDLVSGARPLYDYAHPQQAFYIFGAEDATLGSRITDRCKDTIYVPMAAGCLNLAACVNVVLYDRTMKQNQLSAGLICLGQRGFAPLSPP